MIIQRHALLADFQRFIHPQPVRDARLPRARRVHLIHDVVAVVGEVRAGARNTECRRVSKSETLRYLLTVATRLRGKNVRKITSDRRKAMAGSR